VINKKIQLVTFPRSGHHLVVNVLLKYFSGNINFPITDGKKTDTECTEIIRAGGINYCEFYNHCQKTPCTDQTVNLQKNHDFNLSLANEENNRYIILIRNPLESLVSFFNFFLDLPIKQSIINGNVILDKKGWEDFATKEILFWKDFSNKWILNNRKVNFLFFTYEEILRNPLTSFICMMKFINHTLDIDIEFLQSIIKQMNIENKSILTNFIFYEESFFKKLENSVKEEIKILNMEYYFLDF